MFHARSPFNVLPMHSKNPDESSSSSNLSDLSLREISSDSSKLCESDCSMCNAQSNFGKDEEFKLDNINTSDASTTTNDEKTQFLHNLNKHQECYIPLQYQREYRIKNVWYKNFASQFEDLLCLKEIYIAVYGKFGINLQIGSMEYYKAAENYALFDIIPD